MVTPHQCGHPLNPNSSQTHDGLVLYDDEFERFIVINLGLCRLWHQMLKMAFNAWTMYWVIDSDSD